MEFLCDLVTIAAPFISMASRADGADGGCCDKRDLAEAFASCKSRTAQSPIDIPQVETAEETPTPVYHYRAGSFEVLNNGFTILANYPKGSYLDVNGEAFELVQFHFHTPSEHTVAGRQYPMEAHLVHQNARGELAVVGVFFEEGDADPTVARVWSVMPTGIGKTAKGNDIVNAADLVPNGGSFYSFIGSLTTPPYSEGVKWFMLKEPLTVSADQVAAFKNVIGENARPIQPLNDRNIAAK